MPQCSKQSRTKVPVQVEESQLFSEHRLREEEAEEGEEEMFFRREDKDEQKGQCFYKKCSINMLALAELIKEESYRVNPDMVIAESTPYRLSESTVGVNNNNHGNIVGILYRANINTVEDIDSVTGLVYAVIALVY